MTTRTDWRKTCAELIENVRYLIDCVDRDCFDPVALMECREHLSQTRAALAQPEPEGTGLSDEELLRMVAAVFGYTFRDGGIGGGESEFLSLLRDAIARSATPQPAPVPVPEPGAEVGDEELLRCYGLAKRDHCYEGPMDDWPKRAERAATVHGLRAVLAHYARPTLKPVPVAERLPGPEDCAPWPGEPDATHWAWAGKCVLGLGWEWSQLSMLGLESNTLGRIIAGGGWTHWLPHHALPAPGAEVQS